MDDIRSRRLPRGDTEGGAPGGNRTKSKRLQTSSNKLRFYFLMSIIALTIVFGLYTGYVPLDKYYKHGSNFIDRVSVGLGFRDLVYSAVIDAGSTGSRILAYAFIQGPDKNLKLHKELLFLELKPGLSAFANNPAASKENLENLLKEAKKVIPPDAWPKTPIVMKATAGLRLLPGDKAESLLLEAKKVLYSSGFQVGEDAVSIMDGVDEGLFSWFTVNFLLDRLGGDIGATVAALDLGGGSTQISFAPTTALKTEDQKYLHTIAAFHKKIDIYTHSFLGLGLNEARKGILQYKNTKHSFVLKSECINPIIKEHKWSYGGIGYTIQGPDKPQINIVDEGGEKMSIPVVRFELCVEAAQSILGSIDKPAELNSREIYAFSYYLDRAADGDLINYDIGGVITVADFFKAAKAKCQEPNADQPFLCLDLTFISVLLRDGFGLSPKTKLNLVKRIEDREISWALGAAFHLLQNGS